jgi:lactate racemase
MTESGSFLDLPWGDEKMRVALPSRWRLRDVVVPSGLPPAADPAAEAAASIARPIGCPSLGELCRPGARVALVIDDGSRPTPQSAILPAVLEALSRAGVAREAITLVPALGVHRPMTEGELEQRVGPAAWKGLRWENPDADDESKMAHLGTTRRGTPVWVNRTVAEADLVVSVGCIEPHIIASFGGGYKNLVPGVAGRATIAHNHALNCTPATFNMVGRRPEENPMRLDLEEAAAMLSPPVFIVNAVLDSSLAVVRVVSGHPVAAHREGCRVSRTLYGVPVGAPADIVITDSHPMDSDLRQGVKSLSNTIRAVRRGGALIVLVRAREGTGVFGLANRKFPVGRGALKILAPLLLPLVPRLKVAGMGEEDRFFLYFALQSMRHAHVLMYAPTIPTEVQERMPFVRFVASVEEAIAAASRLVRGRRAAGGAPEVLVFPMGGITYPEVGDGRAGGGDAAGSPR